MGKCYYAKRKLVWEVLENGLKSKIEIQWSDISAMKASCPENLPGTLEIEVLYYCVSLSFFCLRVRAMIYNGMRSRRRRQLEISHDAGAVLHISGVQASSVLQRDEPSATKAHAVADSFRLHRRASYNLQVSERGSCCLPSASGSRFLCLGPTISDILTKFCCCFATGVIRCSSQKVS